MIELHNQIEKKIITAISPYGDDMHLRERERATLFLMEHSSEAALVLMEKIQQFPYAIQTARCIELLGILKNKKSIKLLIEIMNQANPDTCRIAGLALGSIGGAEVEKAIGDGLLNKNNEIIISAVEGLRALKDEELYPQLLSLLQNPDSNLRYYAINAAAELKCITVDKLNDIVKDDTDKFNKELAVSWLKKI